MKTATIANRLKELSQKNRKQTCQSKPEAGQCVQANIFADRVEKKAYELFEKRGCQNGHDWEDWFEAQKIVETEMIAGK